jgi:hypothetical protein
VAGLTEDERYLIADDVVHQLRQHGDPWDLSRELPQNDREGAFDAADGRGLTEQGPFGISDAPERL